MLYNAAIKYKIIAGQFCVFNLLRFSIMKKLLNCACLEHILCILQLLSYVSPERICSSLHAKELFHRLSPHSDLLTHLMPVCTNLQNFVAVLVSVNLKKYKKEVLHELVLTKRIPLKQNTCVLYKISTTNGSRECGC